MASPHVVGVAALTWGLWPELSAAEVRHVVRRNGTGIPAFHGKLFASGPGFDDNGGMRLNAYRSVLAALPPAVQQLAVYTDAGQTHEVLHGVTAATAPYLTWAAAPGLAISSYTVSVNGTSIAVAGPAFDVAAQLGQLGVGTHTLVINGIRADGVGAGAPVALTLSVSASPPVLVAPMPAAAWEQDERVQTISLTEPTDESVTVTLDFAGAAETGVDLTTAATLTWAPGEFGPQTAFTIVDDDVAEDTEVFSMTVAVTAGDVDLVGSTTGSAVYSMAILDDEAPAITITGAQVDSETGALRFAAKLDAPAEREIAVPFTVTAAAGGATTDVSPTSGNLVFPAGVTEVDLDLTVTEDTADEGLETVVLTLASSGVDAARSVLVATGRIVDDDLELTLTPGWNLISTPVTLAAEDVVEILGETGFAWHWDRRRQRLMRTVTLAPKAGYWVYTHEERVITVSGTPTLAPALPLRRGWNLVAPLNTLDAPACAVPSTGFYGLTENGDFRPATELQRRQAYWILVRESCEVDVFE
jgi:hypothetical protein